MVQRMNNKENLELLAEKIRQVDAVVIGGGSGLSSAAGYNHYHWMPYLEGQLQDFKEAYGFQSPFSVFYLLLLFFTRTTVGFLRTLYTKPVGCSNGADLL